jgi:hypothetical protein
VTDRSNYIVICRLIVTLAVIGLGVSALGFSTAVAGQLKDYRSMINLSKVSGGAPD